MTNEGDLMAPPRGSYDLVLKVGLICTHLPYGSDTAIGVREGGEYGTT